VAQLLGVSTLLLALAASAPQPVQPLLRTTTAKSLHAFGACFAEAQEKAAKAWAFMPTPSGGTFTNSGAVGSDAPYWLQVQAGAARGEIRLFGEGGARPPTALIEAVNRCS
jgi:hypothetical protein